MNPQEYARMHALETRYWWFAGRRAIIATLLQAAHSEADLATKANSTSTRRLLDIGCGTGANLEMLRGHVGHDGHLTGLDFSPLALRFARDHLDDGWKESKDAGETAAIEYSMEGSATGSAASTKDSVSDGVIPRTCGVTLLRGDGLHLPFADETFDVVTMLDVLEHLSDDHRALEEVWRVLRPGGALVWSVPASMHLWSAHDEALHHFRRYEFHALRRLLHERGFRIQLMSFAMSLMPLPAWLWRRLILPLQPRRPRNAKRHSEGAVLPAVPPLFNRALIAYLATEGRIITRRPLRLGTSLVGIARKPATKQI